MQLLFQAFLVVSFASGASLGLIGRLLYNRPETGPWGEPQAVVGVPSSVLGGLLAGISACFLVLAHDGDWPVSLLIVYSVSAALTLVASLAHALLLRAKARSRQVRGPRERRVRAGDHLPARLGTVAALAALLAVLVRPASGA